MSIVTLTSDYGNKDFFVGAVKGALLSEIEGVQIIDISHEITPFNSIEAAYIIKNAYYFYPKNTIHIIGINNEINTNEYIALYIDGHYFIGYNSNLFSLIFPLKKPNELVLINLPESYDENLFPAKNIFIKAAGHIARGGELSMLGPKLESLKIGQSLLPIEKNNGEILIGIVIYIDRFGNIITNISKVFFNKFQRGRNFIIHLPRKHTITKLCKQYSEVPESNILTLFNSSNMLEIAINRADKSLKNGASTLLGVKPGDEIIIKFN